MQKAIFAGGEGKVLGIISRPNVPQHANIALNAFRPIRLVCPSKLKWETNLSMGCSFYVVC